MKWNVLNSYQFLDGFREVILGVNDEDDGATVVENLFSLESWVEEVDLTWEIPDSKFHKRGIVHL